MVDFLKIRPAKTKKLILKLELELINSKLTEEEATDQVEKMIRNGREFSELIVALLRTTSSSMWGIKTAEITAEKTEEKEL